VLASLALVLSYVEALVPASTTLPGVKLGLANMAVLVALYALGPGYAFTVNGLRILLAGALFGTPFSMAYAAAGGLVSFLVMLALQKTGKFSMVAISMAGGVFHNVGQVAVAVLLLNTPEVWSLLTPLGIAGMVCGLVTGMVSHILYTRIPKGLVPAPEKERN
jgi:heptaprenyl diphosphate synthase